ncbi:MAG: glycosyl hydrolase, partial [Planctomycetota bacterium]
PEGQLAVSGTRTEFSGPVLAIAALSDESSTAAFARHAAAIPRGTKFDWTYEPGAGRVETTWQVRTSNGQPVLQGWIPHHYRKTVHNLNLNGIEFTTRRGRMKLAAGIEFRIAWAFSGITPAFPLPRDDRFDASRLGALIEAWAEELLAKPEAQRHAADTYWGGKSMLKTAQAFTMAKQLELPVADRLLEEAKRVATDWLTYRDGEEAYYYARYPAPWNGIVGFNPSYGSDQFTDNHFHYGYLVMTAALIGMHDREWLDRYSDGLREVVRQYAQWERDSVDFPRLRTFECWAGHSYAAGMSNGFDGNNQESSSEATGSWAGVFLLGAVLDDQEMLATGAMGFAIETEAIHEYWNNVYGWNDPESSNWSPDYEPTICSVVRDRDVGAWTWFSGEPIHIYGIQWLPAWTHSHYFGAHHEHAAYQLDQMMIRQGKDEGRLEWSDLDDDWGQVTTGYAAFCVPEEVCDALDEAFENKWPIASPRFAGTPYYLAHACRAYGFVDADAYTDLPTSLVMKTSDGRRTAIVYNAGNVDRTIAIYVYGRKVKAETIPANSVRAIPLETRE